MTTPTPTLIEKVDCYLKLHKQSAKIEAEMATLSTDLKALGPSIVKGTLGSVEISSVAGRKTTEWKLVAAAANVPQKTIDKYTKTGAASSKINVTHNL